MLLNIQDLNGFFCLHLIRKVTDAVVCPDMSKVVVASEQGRLFVFPAIVEATFDEDQVYISSTFFTETLQKSWTVL